VSFFERGGLPALGNGKVDRKALAEILGHAIAQPGTQQETTSLST
jgi:hypothetical protein